MRPRDTALTAMAAMSPGGLEGTGVGDQEPFVLRGSRRAIGERNNNDSIKTQGPLPMLGVVDCGESWPEVVGSSAWMFGSCFLVFLGGKAQVPSLARRPIGQFGTGQYQLAFGLCLLLPQSRLQVYLNLPDPLILHPFSLSPPHSRSSISRFYRFSQVSDSLPFYILIGRLYSIYLSKLRTSKSCPSTVLALERLLSTNPLQPVRIKAL